MAETKTRRTITPSEVARRGFDLVVLGDHPDVRERAAVAVCRFTGERFTVTATTTNTGELLAALVLLIETTDPSLWRRSGAGNVGDYAIASDAKGRTWRMIPPSWRAALPAGVGAVVERPKAKRGSGWGLPQGWPTGKRGGQGAGFTIQRP